MRNKYGGRWIKDLALQRSILLYREAVNALGEGNVDLARRYVKLGLKVLGKGNVRKPAVYRRWICKNCGVPLIPGITATVRVKSGRKQIIVVKKCLMCGWVMRTPCRKSGRREGALA